MRASIKKAINITLAAMTALTLSAPAPAQANVQAFAPTKAPAGSRCPQHYNAAMAAGWTHAQWSKIDFIMWRESRCFPTAYNGRGRDDSYGLMQLNMRAHRSWVGPLVDWDFTRLYNPTTNLRVAKQLYDKARTTFGCGFQPWKTTKQRHWCN